VETQAYLANPYHFNFAAPAAALTEWKEHQRRRAEAQQNRRKTSDTSAVDVGAIYPNSGLEHERECAASASEQRQGGRRDGRISKRKSNRDLERNYDSITGIDDDHRRISQRRGGDQGATKVDGSDRGS
jgi:hypothetical protein